MYSTPQTSCGAQRFASVPASAGPILSLDETHDCPRPRSPGLDDLGSYALYRSRSRSYRAQCDRFTSISMRCPLHAFGASDEHVPVLIELDEEGGSRVARASVERCLVTRRHPSATRPAIPMAIEGYGAFSVSERAPGIVMDYIRRRRERHRSGDLAAEWEFVGGRR